jgi:hypothetical protein
MSSRPALPSEDRRVGGLSDAGHPQRPGPCPLPLEINGSQPDSVVCCPTERARLREVIGAPYGALSFRTVRCGVGHGQRKRPDLSSRSRA